MYSCCLGARSPCEEEEEAGDVIRAAWIYKVGYKLLVTQCAIAVCTDLISLFTYPDFALSLTNSLYLMFPECSFQCCSRRENKQFNQAAEFAEQPVHA